MNKLLIICLLLFLLPVCSCRINKDENAYKKEVQKVIINKAIVLKKITDSLNNAGVKEILSVDYFCENCADWDFDTPLDTKAGYELSVFSAPAYVFWQDSSSYYIKKIDQFGIYQTIERHTGIDFMLFDFFVKNKVELKTEHTAVTRHDLNPSIPLIKYGSDSLFYREVYYDAYPGLKATSDNSYFRNNFENNMATIRIIKDGETFEKKLVLYEFEPIRIDSKPDYTIGNSTQTYYKNQSMKVYLWLKLIEGQLFSLEGKVKWQNQH